ncbi:hypothetical protein BMT55_08260 [Listeria newyorkensis]|uniref:SMI1/KNR4 family protein n=1 Tax=Listeria newyorkensis TaxID=1497681 RepID=A0ABX4XM85_9LIST|nr:SMI1/KNR4 family protein [Listeria newyorkensis]PNP92552.1 hypothetical protein BMT55_08260 [Listeria newyorkensis]
MTGLIESVLDILRNKYKEGIPIEVALNNGDTTYVICEYNEPINKSEIELFEHQTSKNLPNDYKTFLTYFNGAVLYSMYHMG